MANTPLSSPFNDSQYYSASDSETSDLGKEGQSLLHRLCRKDASKASRSRFEQIKSDVRAGSSNPDHSVSESSTKKEISFVQNETQGSSRSMQRSQFNPSLVPSSPSFDFRPRKPFNFANSKENTVQETPKSSSHTLLRSIRNSGAIPQQSSMPPVFTITPPIIAPNGLSPGELRNQLHYLKQELRESKIREMYQEERAVRAERKLSRIAHELKSTETKLESP